MGQLFLVGAIGGVIGTVLGGRLYDRLRGHTVLGVAGISSGLLLGCVPWMPSLGWLLALVLIRGVMDGIINNGTNTLIVWTHREKVSPYMSGLHFFFGLGAFISPLLVAQVIEIPGAYRWIYMGLSFVIMLVGLRVLTMAGSPHADHPAADPTASPVPSRPVPYKLAVVAALFLFFYVGAEIAFGGWIYTYAVGLQLASVAVAAYLTSAFWLSFTIGRLLSVPLAIHFQPRQIIAVALLGCLFFMGLIGVFIHSSTVLWVSVLGVGFCMAPIYASGFTLAVHGLTLSGRTSGIILLGDSFGGMVLPWLVGFVLGLTGPSAMATLVFGSLLFDLVAFAGLLRVRAKIHFSAP
jgi:fucose permease